MANQTRQLAELLQAERTVVDVVRVNAPYRPAWIASWRGIRAVFRLAPYLCRLWSAARNADLFHVVASSGWSWHLFAAPAVWIGALRGVPVVVNYRGGEAATFLERSIRRVRPTLARTAALAVPSGFLQGIFAKHRIDSRIVPNVVDLERFRPGVRPTQRDPSAPHLIVVRGLEPIYDIGTAIKAFAGIRARFARARLSVAGTGPELESLRTLARSLGIEAEVSFLGRLDRDQVATLYRDADVALNPSRIDNMPNSVLEALASGVPVVSTDVGGVPFIVAHRKTALLVGAGDARAMAEAALAVLEDASLRSALVTAGLAEAQRYAWPRVRDDLLAVYNDCLTMRSAGGPRLVA
jgi:glycosyltransferase involved in cell wall biosynthesis